MVLPVAGSMGLGTERVSALTTGTSRARFQVHRKHFGGGGLFTFPKSNTTQFCPRSHYSCPSSDTQAQLPHASQPVRAAFECHGFWFMCNAPHRITLSLSSIFNEGIATAQDVALLHTLTELKSSSFERLVHQRPLNTGHTLAL